MFIVCVTDTQPKECKGVWKRLMDVVNVDYGKHLSFAMKENERWIVSLAAWQNPHIESEMQSYFQSSHRYKKEKPNSECFTITNILFVIVATVVFSQYLVVKRGLKAIERWGVGYLKWNVIWQDSEPPHPNPMQIHIFPLHGLVLKSPSSSILLYTYTR